MVIISPVWVSNSWSTRWIRLVFLSFFIHWFIVLSAWAFQCLDTPHWISTKKLVPKETSIPVVHVNNFGIGIPTFLCSLIYCVNSVRVSAVYAKYVSMPIHHFEFPQKNQFPNKPGFPLSTLIILDWYPYVSLFPDLLCKFGSSVSSLRKIRFNAYTPLRISTKKSVPKQTRIPIVHVNNFRLVSLRFSVPWFIV